MRKVLPVVSILCSATLCGIYAYRTYMGEQVDAVAALIPWLFCLANEITLRGEDK